jgi:hypothetical protein
MKPAADADGPRPGGLGPGDGGPGDGGPGDGAGGELPDDGSDELSPVTRLVTEVLERLDEEGTAAVDAACREHPGLADELRRRIDALEQVGLLGRARFGPYQLLRLLCRGGMGVVHLARDTRDGRLVALKALPGRLLRSARARERFRREAQAVGSSTTRRSCR